MSTPAEENLFLSNDNKDYAERIFNEAIESGIDFKLQDNVREQDASSLTADMFLEDIPESGMPLEDIDKEFKEKILPYCTNWSSTGYMGFPDAGNSIAAIKGSIMSDFLQQNLANQAICSPSGTFVEIAVIQWLRSLVGYENNHKVDDVFDAGGIITGGGTTSNASGILLARENFKKNTMFDGVVSDDNYYVIVPKGIGHYSVKSAQMWVGCGNKLIEVDTDNFRYDLDSLREALNKYKGKVMALVAYAGDSRTMTVEYFDQVASLVRSIDPGIWLHVDACHGFSLGFSDKLKHKLKGAEQFDSITIDPHKVMNIPYVASALLVRDPKSIEMISSTSDLILKEDFAFGQVTPFIGSKPWISLKLWYAIKHIGRDGYGKVIEARHEFAKKFAAMIDDSDDFVRLNEVGINSVMFMYTGGETADDLDRMNSLSSAIHAQTMKDGRYFLHHFPIQDSGVIEKDALLRPLRFMCGNPNTTEKDLEELLGYLRGIGQDLVEQQQAQYPTI